MMQYVCLFLATWRELQSFLPASQPPIKLTIHLLAHLYVRPSGRLSASETSNAKSSQIVVITCKRRFSRPPYVSDSAIYVLLSSSRKANTISTSPRGNIT